MAPAVVTLVWLLKLSARLRPTLALSCEGGVERETGGGSHI